jgi:DNA adenine methylase
MKPILKYPGAKWALAPWIVQYLPRTPHYVEPYCGSAAVFFNLPWRPKHAVLNDLSGDIVNLFRVIRERGDELAALIEMTPWAREEYELSYTPTDDSLERARRFVVRVWQANSADISKAVGWRNVGGQFNASTIPVWRRLPVQLRATCDALLEAEIENTSAVEIVQKYCGVDTLLYVDPPYPLSTRSGKLYAHEMTDADHVALLDALDAHPGPVVLSGYHCALYDDRLRHWQTVETKAQAEKGNTRTEVLWLNDKAAGAQQHTMTFEEVV